MGIFNKKKDNNTVSYESLETDRKFQEIDDFLNEEIYKKKTGKRKNAVKNAVKKYLIYCGSMLGVLLVLLLVGYVVKNYDLLGFLDDTTEQVEEIEEPITYKSVNKDNLKDLQYGDYIQMEVAAFEELDLDDENEELSGIFTLIFEDEIESDVLVKVEECNIHDLKNEHPDFVDALSKGKEKRGEIQLTIQGIFSGIEQDETNYDDEDIITFSNIPEIVSAERVRMLKLPDFEDVKIKNAISKLEKLGYDTSNISYKNDDGKAIKEPNKEWAISDQIPGFYEMIYYDTKIQLTIYDTEDFKYNLMQYEPIGAIKWAKKRGYKVKFYDLDDNNITSEVKAHEKREYSVSYYEIVDLKSIDEKNKIVNLYVEEEVFEKYKNTMPR